VKGVLSINPRKIKYTLLLKDNILASSSKQEGKVKEI
jgi:hypothetical protein